MNTETTVNVTPENFTRITNDYFGNPRYVCHFLNVANDYASAVKIANSVGGRKYHTKSYGGGLVFQSYNLDSTCKALNAKIQG